MYDFRELEITGKGMAIAVLVVFVLLVVAGSVGYMCGLRNAGKDVPDNGDPAAGVRNEIESAGSGISTAKSRIDNAAAAADRVEARISDAQGRVEYLKTTADDGRRIIAECQSILREVRRGGEENPVKN